MQAFYALCWFLKVSQGTLSMKCLSMDWTVHYLSQAGFLSLPPSRFRFSLVWIHCVSNPCCKSLECEAGFSLLSVAEVKCSISYLDVVPGYKDDYHYLLPPGQRNTSKLLKIATKSPYNPSYFSLEVLLFLIQCIQLLHFMCIH